MKSKSTKFSKIATSRKSSSPVSSKRADIVEIPHKAPVPTDPMATQPLAAHSGKTKVNRRDRNSSSLDGRPPAKITDLAPGAKVPRIRYYLPEVAQFIARIIVHHGMDYHAAIVEIVEDSRFSFFGTMSDRQISTLVEGMRNSKEVQAAINEELKIHGFDEESMKSFGKLMWGWIRHGSTEEKLKAATVLEHIFITQKTNSEKPSELPIAGLTGVVERMLGKPGVETAIPVNRGPVNAESLEQSKKSPSPKAIELQGKKNDYPTRLPN